MSEISIAPTPVPAGATATPDAAQARLQQPWYRWYVLMVLLIVYIFNFIDRTILSILNEPIKKALHAADWQMGFLGGIAFAAVYTIVGIPVARLADRSVRRNVLAVSLAVWSSMTVLCGFATSFTMLLFARLGVGIGEAGGSPPSHSIISDLFPPQSRGTALAIYALGIPAGSMIGALAGGVINAHFNWQTAFMVVGAPGLLFALFVRFAVIEPQRKANSPMGADRAANAVAAIDASGGAVHESARATPSILEAMHFLWARKSFRFITLAAALHSFVGYGVGYWVPSFFVRSHHVDTATLGVWFFWLGVPAMLSTFFGGWVGDRMARRDVRWYVWLPAITPFITVPFAFFVYLWPDFRVALLVSILPGLLASVWLAPTFALTQGLVSVRMRALAASIMLFVVNFIGLGLGPLITGVLSDVLHATTALGSESLRWSLITVSLVGLGSSVCYVYAARTLKQDLARAEEL